MEVDYILVGIGIAGISFCEQLVINGKSFIVFDNKSQQSSTVAGGLYNPVVLKRFTAVWKTTEMLEIALPHYSRIEKRLGVKLDYKIPVYRKFSSLEEQNNWFAASDKPVLSKYLHNTIIKNSNPFVNAPFGFGKVLTTGRVDTNTLLKAYKKDLLNSRLLREGDFNYSKLKVKSEGVVYENINAKQVVFAEGFGLIKNPYFSNLPLTPVKGELLIILAPELNIDYVLKAGVFLIPLGNHLYYVGATYSWTNLNDTITNGAKEELLEKLAKVITSPFEVVNHYAGVRPAVKDRKPLIGHHSEVENVFILNGLGSRGVMIGPYVAKQLYNFIEFGTPLDKEVDVNRFTK